MKDLHPLSHAATVSLSHGPGTDTERRIAPVEFAALRPAKIAVIDDTSFFLTQWKRRLLKTSAPTGSSPGEAQPTVSVECFLSPAAFWLAVKQQPGFLESLTCVIVDLHFDEPEGGGGHLPVGETNASHSGQGPCSGIELAKELRARAPEVVIFLNTCSPFVDPAWRECVDLCMDKEVLSWDRLAAKIAEARARRMGGVV